MRKLSAMVLGLGLVAVACGGSNDGSPPVAEPSGEPSSPAPAPSPTLLPSSERLPLFTIDWPRTDFANRTVDLTDVIQGCPGRDCIPALDAEGEGVVSIPAPRGGHARFTAVSEATYEPQLPVAAVEVNGVARAYPLHVLTFHEIVNDVLGGVPLTMTFCPLCNTAIAFSREVDGEILDFGVSGLLRNSDLIMYDRQTESLWQQATGEGIAGQRAGVRLDFLAARIISWAEFAGRYPEGTVLTEDTGFGIPYGENPYVRYDSGTSRPFLFNGELDDRLPALDRVVGLVNEDNALAVPFSWLAENHAANLQVGSDAVVVLWAPGTVSALDGSSIADSRDVGTAAAYLATAGGISLTFASAGDGTFTDRETGSTWDVTGRAIDGPLAGATLGVYPHANHFWFAFAAFYPGTPIWGTTATS
jgi:hypothetical protein